MPIKVRKIRGQDCYRVFNAETGEIHAKCSTRKDALEQKRILDNVDKKKEDNNESDEEIEIIDQDLIIKDEDFQNILKNQKSKKKQEKN